ncbi:T9SS type A sorting domain-containing protein [Tenacibaculum amylolyticum]|uniref:T9SS type A sorting domain-containing protein n=1 Tax=Tenacibaculum amylolyticum TaxID=104269 RepID=UPI00389654C7
MEIAGTGNYGSWDKDSATNYSEDCNTFTWTGATDSNWITNGNWSYNQTPSNSNNITIPNVANQPVISSGVMAEINDLTIEALGSFDISDGGTVVVNGNFSTTETINIQSSATTSGTFIVKGTANGMVTFERSGLEANKWSMVTAPVSGQSVKQFVENSANDIRINTTVTPNRYAVGHYDDSRADGTKWVYYTVDDLASDTVTFEEGKSYIVSRETNGSVTFTGTLQTNDLSVGVAAEQWNAIGSPYTAYLPINNNSDVNFIQENLSKFDPAYVGVYVWDNDQNKYVAKTLVSAVTSLTVGQGFFVKTGTGVTTMDFSEEQRLHNGAEVAAFSRGTNSEIPTIQIIAEQGGVAVDTNIKYVANTTKGLDAGYDIGNFGGNTFDVFTHLVESPENKDFTIQSLPNSDFDTTVIPLGFISEADKEIKLSINTIALPSEVKVYIEDRATGDFTEIGAGSSYSFTTTSKLTGIGRFYIHTSAKVLDIEDVASVNGTVEIFKSGNQEVTIKGLEQGEVAIVKLYSVLGSEIYSSKIVGDTMNKITPDVLETGIYIVRVEGTAGITSKKIVFNK